MAPSPVPFGVAPVTGPGAPRAYRTTSFPSAMRVMAWKHLHYSMCVGPGGGESSPRYLFPARPFANQNPKVATYVAPLGFPLQDGWC